MTKVRCSKGRGKGGDEENIRKDGGQDNCQRRERNQVQDEHDDPDERLNAGEGQIQGRLHALLRDENYFHDIEDYRHAGDGDLDAGGGTTRLCPIVSFSAFPDSYRWCLNALLRHSLGHPFAMTLSGGRGVVLGLRTHINCRGPIWWSPLSPRRTRPVGSDRR